MRRSAGDNLPTLGLPVLAGMSGEAVDSSALSFFTAQTLLLQKEAREKEQEKEAAKVKLELDVLMRFPVERAQKCGLCQGLDVRPFVKTGFLRERGPRIREIWIRALCIWVSWTSPEVMTPVQLQTMRLMLVSP